MTHIVNFICAMTAWIAWIGGSTALIVAHETMLGLIVLLSPLIGATLILTVMVLWELTNPDS